MQTITQTENSPTLDATPVEASVSRLLAVMASLARKGSLRDPLAASSEQLQLTPAQMHAVMSLGHEDGLTMGELSRRGGITEKTMTGVVDRLEAAGHVLRERDVNDRRVVRVRLTEQGRQVFVSCDRHIAERMTRFMSLLTPADRDGLCGILERLTTTLDEKAALAAEDRS